VSESLLSVAGVRKTYLSGDRRIEVLRDISFTITAGESVSIRGESGSGKSTLLNLFAGLDTPDAGKIQLAGSTTLDHAARGKLIGIVFQSFYLIPELSAFENVLMAARIAGKVGEKEKARESVIDILLGLCAETQTALVLVTHNAAHAERCARRFVLHEGVLAPG
jgi:predicted ABC-type transport system involved in lysophospholipase L1 biosynthesis ATPase subunit